MKYYVEVVDLRTDAVVKRIGPIATERRAVKVESGFMINMDSEKYITRIVEEK